MIALENQFRAELLASGALHELPDSIGKIVERVTGTEFLPDPDPSLDKALAESTLDVEELGKLLLVRSFRGFDETVRAHAAGDDSGEGFVFAARFADAASRLLASAEGMAAREIRGEALCSLSCCLAKLGELRNSFSQRKESAKLLLGAVVAGDDASEAFGERDNPKGWARAQCVYAHALRLWGNKDEFDENEDEDEDGFEIEDEDKAFGILLEAIDAGMAAQRVLTMLDAPLEWARIQNFIVSVAIESAEFEIGRREMEILFSAISMQLKALEILDREKDPLDWAVAQEQLGMAKSGLSFTGKLELEQECELEKEAAEAFNAALLVRRREDEPELWAANQKRLASALQSQATMDSDENAVRIYGEAIAAYEAALEVYTLEEFVVDFHYCHCGLGDSLVDLADQDNVADPRGLLERALKSYQSAMRACEDSFGREDVQNDMDKAQRKLATLISSTNSCSR